MCRRVDDQAAALWPSIWRSRAARFCASAPTHRGRSSRLPRAGVHDHCPSGSCDVDERVVHDAPPDDAHVVRRDVGERPERAALVAFEPRERLLVRGAVLALVGLGHPLLEVQLERGEAGELADLTARNRRTWNSTTATPGRMSVDPSEAPRRGGHGYLCLLLRLAIRPFSQLV